MVYKTKGTCSSEIHVDLNGDTIEHVTFVGGCSGNTQGVDKLVEGMKAEDAIARLEGIRCGVRPTTARSACKGSEAGTREVKFYRHKKDLHKNDSSFCKSFFNLHPPKFLIPLFPDLFPAFFLIAFQKVLNFRSQSLCQTVHPRAVCSYQRVCFSFFLCCGHLTFWQQIFCLLLPCQFSLFLLRYFFQFFAFRQYFVNYSKFFQFRSRHLHHFRGFCRALSILPKDCRKAFRGKDRIDGIF